jgi:hydroxyacylglutathione hydrolase
MKQLFDDIWQTDTETPAPGLTTHAYLMKSAHGNVLFYNTGLTQEIEQMASLGGVDYQYLSHEDELGESLNVIGERYGAKLAGHINERETFSRIRTPDIFLQHAETHLGCIDIIPTPGHTPGSTCFLVRSATGARYLFTGDTLYYGRGDYWRAGFVPGVHQAAHCIQMAESLELLQDLEPDVVFSSAFADGPGYQQMAAGQWKAIVAESIRGIRTKAVSLARSL